MKNLTLSFENGNWKYQLETNFDSTSIDSAKELADIFAKIIIEANAHPQHVIMKLQEIFPNVKYKDE